MSCGAPRRLAALLVAIVLLAFGADRSPARADALERIAKTGVLRVGTRADARPFAYRDTGGNFAGFSVDLIQMIRRSLAEQLGRPLELDVQTVTTQSRLTLLQRGALDLVCGVTTPTWARERRVDFTVPIFVDSTRILTYRRFGQSGMDGLQGKRIGVLKSATTQRVVALALPSVDLVPFDSMTAAMTALEAREIAAVANIGVLLETLRIKSRQAMSLMLIPRHGVLEREFMACAVPENQSPLRDAVNRALSQSFKGLDELSGDYADIYFAWFGYEGDIYYPLTETQRNILLASRIWLK